MNNTTNTYVCGGLFLIFLAGCTRSSTFDGVADRSANDLEAVPTLTRHVASASPVAVNTAEREADVAEVEIVTKPVTTYYDDGGVKRHFYACEKTNERHGEFCEFYPDGRRFCTGAYRRGERHGRWQFWHPGGVLARSADYKNGYPIGTWCWYRLDGSLEREKSFQRGLAHGDAIWYGDDGESLVRRESFQAGRRHGVLVCWHENGRKAHEVEFQNGKPNGEETRWYESGIRRAVGYYLNGSPHGLFRYWSADGGLFKEIRWRDGRRLSSNFPRSK